MKHLRRPTASHLLIAALLMLITIFTPYHVYSAVRSGKQHEKQRVVKDSKVKTGAEVAARVKSLKEHNKEVRAAFKAFERRGRVPKMGEALLMSATIEFQETTDAAKRSQRRLFRKASFTPLEQTTVSGGGYELILVPSLEVDGEWQGTAICTRYDEYGYIVEQYASNLVTVADYSGNTTVVYEVRYENGTPYLLHEPGMYTGFALGMTIAEHQAHFGTPPPLNIEPWQFVTSEQQQLYYELHPQQREYDLNPYRSPDMEQPSVARATKPLFMRASFQRSDRAIDRGFVRNCGVHAVGCGPGPGAMFSPREKKYFVNVAFGCAGAALTCRGNPQCTSLACAGVAVARLPILFGY
ncbi:MAG TPA: hypothetical protein VF766_07115 [Pyrinomonadaceae bacterium]